VVNAIEEHEDDEENLEEEGLYEQSTTCQPSKLLTTADEDEITGAEVDEDDDTLELLLILNIYFTYIFAMCTFPSGKVSHGVIFMLLTTLYGEISLDFAPIVCKSILIC